MHVRTGCGYRPGLLYSVRLTQNYSLNRFRFTELLPRGVPAHDQFQEPSEGCAAAVVEGYPEQRGRSVVQAVAGLRYRLGDTERCVSRKIDSYPGRFVPALLL